MINNVFRMLCKSPLKTRLPIQRILGRTFCKGKGGALDISAGTGDKESESYGVNSELFVLDEENKIKVDFNDHFVSYELPENLSGTTFDTMGHFMMMMTCRICKTKQSITFTKRAYYQGSIVHRCQGCNTNHLIADNLGWFKDEDINIEQIMAAKGEEVRMMRPDETTQKILLEKIKETRLRNEQRNKKQKNPN